MKKILSLALAAAMVVSAVPMAYAADTQDYSQGTQVSYTAANNDSYTITVPAKLIPGTAGTVTLDGYWPSNKIITVTAQENVVLTNSINAADTKTLAIDFNDGISEAGSNTEKQTFTETVSVEEIKAALFGTWNGHFYYTVGSYLKGDANNDGVVDMYDKKYVQEMVASNFNGLSDEEMAGLIARADMDGDGYVSGADAATIATLVVNSGWVFAYVNPHTYNGVELPGLPDWDESTYAYATITEGDEFAPYYLNLYTHEIKYDDNKVYTDESGAKVVYGSIDECGEWNLQPKGVAFTEESTINYPVIWTNTDILNADGSVYLAASDPVPVS